MKTIKYSKFKCNDCGKIGDKPACIGDSEKGYFGCSRCTSSNIENLDTLTTK